MLDVVALKLATFVGRTGARKSSSFVLPLAVQNDGHSAAIAKTGGSKRLLARIMT
jgi:hypothetical protein